MKHLFTLLCLILLFKISASSQIIEKEKEIEIKIINKKILDLSDSCDLNTPIGTSVKFNYAVVKKDNNAIFQMSSPRIRDNISRCNKPANKKIDYAKSETLNSTILEVLNYRDSVACVIRKSGDSYIAHYLTYQNGKWMHEGENLFSPDLRKIRANFRESLISFYLKSSHKIKMLNTVSTDTTLFIKYLKKNGVSPKEFIMRQISQYRLVIYGELHRRKVSWDLMQSVISSSDFSKYVGTIFLELSIDGQEYIDRFFYSKDKNPEIILNMFRNEELGGWNDKGMYEFILKLWDINKELPIEKKLKIITTDTPKPFYKKGINVIDDYRDYSKSRIYFRNNNMADKIEQYLKTSQDKRNCFFIVGYDHAWKSQADIKGANPQNPDRRTAGAILTEKLFAKNVFSIFTHSPIITNRGVVNSLIRNGLFDYIFTQVGNKPIAFDLKDNPFGEEPFDASESRFNSELGNYSDCFDGYIFLQPLEAEESDYYLPELYTREFIKEIKRRASIIGEEDYILFGDIPIREMDYEDAVTNIKKDKSEPRFHIHPLR
jgi:hypothetical protein